MGMNILTDGSIINLSETAANHEGDNFNNNSLSDSNRTADDLSVFEGRNSACDLAVKQLRQIRQYGNEGKITLISALILLPRPPPQLKPLPPPVSLRLV